MGGMTGRREAAILLVLPFAARPASCWLCRCGCSDHQRQRQPLSNRLRKGTAKRRYQTLVAKTNATEKRRPSFRVPDRSHGVRMLRHHESQSRRRFSAPAAAVIYIFRRLRGIVVAGRPAHRSNLEPSRRNARPRHGCERHDGVSLPRKVYSAYGGDKANARGSRIVLIAVLLGEPLPSSEESYHPPSWFLILKGPQSLPYLPDSPQASIL